VYQAALTSSVELDPAQPPTQLDVAGKLEVLVQEAGPSRVELALDLSGSKVTLRSATEQTDSDKLAGELGSPIFATLSGGKLSDLQVPPAAATVTVAVLRTLLNALEFVPAEHAASLWQAAGFDATGAFIAEYKLGSVPDHAVRKKLRYTTAPSLLVAADANFPLGGVKFTPAVTASDTEFIFHDSDIAAVSSSEELHTKLNVASEVVSKTTLTLTLESKVVAAAPSEWIVARSSARHLAPAESYVNAADRVNLDGARVTGVKFEQLLSDLESAALARQKLGLPALAKDGEPDPQLASADAYQAIAQRESHAFGLLNALFREQPATVSRALAAIRHRSPAATGLLDALSSSNSPGSQAALVQLMLDPSVDKKLRVSAATSLIRVQTASPETVAALSQLTKDSVLAQHALYGLGSFERRLREAGEATRARSVGDRLIKELAEAKGPSDQATVLRAIANSGDVLALPAVRPYLSSDQDSLRLAAVQALRLMDCPEAATLVAERLTKDSASIVRDAALDAARVRAGVGTSRVPPALLAAVDAQARTASDSHSRLQAVRLLTAWLQREPELRQTLGSVVNNDQEQNIRETAQRALGS
jgi:hypothetical protein